MNIFGRIALCGTTSQYNKIDNHILTSNNTKNPTSLATATSSPGSSNLSLAVSHRLKLQGFIWSDHNDIINEFNTFMSKWIAEGKVKWKENIFEGLENAPRAFVSLFKGESLGRTLVKLGI